MIIGLEWGKKSVAYERLWDIADALEVPVSALLNESGSPAKYEGTVAADAPWVLKSGLRARPRVENF